MVLPNTLKPLVIMTGLLLATLTWPAEGAIIHRYLMEDGVGTTIVDSIGTAHGTAISWDGGTVGWRGTVGTLAYFDYALSPGEIATHYQTGLVPEPASLTMAALGLLIGGPLVGRRRKRSRCSHRDIAATKGFGVQDSEEAFA